MTDAPAEITPPQHEPSAASAAADAAPAPHGGHAGQVADGRRQTPLVLRLIAALELVKGLLAGAVGFLVMTLSHHDIVETLNSWLRALGLDPDAHILHKVVAWCAGIPVAKLRLAGDVFYLYAVLYLTVAVGLWLDQTWAEWLTIVITGLLIPYEISEMFQHITLTMVLLFVLNVAVVLYLGIRVRRKMRLHHLRKVASAAAALAAADAPVGRSGGAAPSP